MRRGVDLTDHKEHLRANFEFQTWLAITPSHWLSARNPIKMAGEAPSLVSANVLLTAPLLHHLHLFHEDPWDTFYCYLTFFEETLFL